MLKRIMSMILCMAMVLAMLPVRAFATEETVTETVAETTMPETTAPVMTQATSDPAAEEETAAEELAESAVSAVATSGICGDALTWAIDEAYNLTISGTGDMYDYKASGASGAPWYVYRDRIVSVTLPEGMTSIGDYGFIGCKTVTALVIPEGVTEIGTRAFSGCSKLASVVLPGSVTEIGEHAFYNCANLLGIAVPEGVTEIKAYTFQQCDKLEYVELPVGLVAIGKNAFDGCESLPEIVLPESLTGIGAYAFYDCNKLASVAIPDNVTEIGEYAFSGCDVLTDVSIGDGVTTIGYSAFRACSRLTNVDIPRSVTSIGAYAFAGNDSMTSLILPSSLTEIGEYAFWDCEGLTYAKIYARVSGIAGHTFDGCTSLASVELPDSLAEIGAHAFNGCERLQEVTIPEGVSAIGENAFANCKSLTEMTLPEGVVSIGDSAFYGCRALERITIPDSVANIGTSAFAWCESLRTAGIPEDVMSLNRTFQECKSLTGVTLPESLTDIGEYTFYGCKSLNGIEIPAGVTSIGAEAFAQCENLAEAAIPAGVTSIGKSAFSYCKKLTYIAVPEGVTTLDSAFHGCAGLTHVTLPDGLLTIDGTFADCVSLLEVEIPASVTRIGGSAFRNCKSLTSLEIPKRVDTIGSSAFSGCTGLTDIIIPGRVSLISEATFSGCTGLKSVKIPDRVKNIRQGAFQNCDSLTSVAIPGRVTSIGSGVFKDCANLAVVTIPESVTYIGSEAFYSCPSLTDVYYGGSEQQWKEINIVYSNYELNDVTMHYNVPISVQDYYDLVIEPDAEEFTVAPGERLQLKVSLYCNDAPVTDWLCPSAHANGSDKLKNMEWEKVGSGWQLTLVGGEPGKQTLTISDISSGESREVTVKVVPTQMQEYLDNCAIEINGSGSAYAYYKGDPGVTYHFSVNGGAATGKSSDKGILKVPLGTYKIVGSHDLAVKFTQVGDLVLNPAVTFDAKVTVKPLEFTEQWEFSLDSSMGVELSGGVNFALGAFKSKATLGMIGAGAGMGNTLTGIRTYAEGKETLELLSSWAEISKLGVESGITGEILKADVDIAHVSAEAEAVGTTTYGLRIADYSAENTAYRKAIATFLLGEALRHRANHSILKQFQKKLAESAYDQSGVELVSGTGVEASGNFESGMLALEINDIPVLAGLSGSSESSVSIEQKNYSGGDASYSTSFVTEKNLNALSANDGLGLLGMDYLGKDVTVEVQREEGEKTLETSSLSASAADVSYIVLGKQYTADYNNFVFRDDTLKYLMEDTKNFRAYMNGSKIAVGNGDLKEMAKVISESELPIEYNNREKSQLLYAIPIEIGMTLGVGVNFETNISYLQSVEHTTARGYAANDEILVTGVSDDYSAQISGRILRLEDLVRSAITALKEEADAFFKKVSGSIRKGVVSAWCWTREKIDSVHDWVVTLTAPVGETDGAWMVSDRVDVSLHGSLGKAATVGRPIVLGVTDEKSGAVITDLSDDPLTFTIRFLEEELQVAGFHSEDATIQNGGIAMYRYNDAGDYFAYIGGEVDLEAMTVTATILAPGQYILAVALEKVDEQPAEPRDMITLRQAYVALEVGQSVQMFADTTPAYLANTVRWTVDDDSVLRVDSLGNVTAKAPGTAYVIATVTDGAKEMTARCRVDVAQSLKLEGVKLGSNKLTAELYSTDYTKLDILLMLPQNYAAAADGAPAAQTLSAAISEAYFTDPALAALFSLNVLDDRTLEIVPTDVAISSEKIAKSYSGTVTVTVEGTSYVTDELTLAVKTSLPKLKVIVPAFNSFCSGQSQAIQVTGATVTDIRAEELPEWLALGEKQLYLTEKAPRKNASAKVSLEIWTEEWAVPVHVAVAVKNTYKAPGLKLSASSVQLSDQPGSSAGVELRLLPKNKKETLSDLRVCGISAPEGYRIENYADGTFTLKPEAGFASGKINLEVSFFDTGETVQLPITVKAAQVKLKPEVSSVSLNAEIGDSALVGITAAPADYVISGPAFRLVDGTGSDKLSSGELEIRFEDGAVRINTTDRTPIGGNYTLFLQAGGSREVAIKIKTLGGAPALSLKQSSNLDLSFDAPAVITPAYKNYAGGRIAAFKHTVMETKSGEDATGFFEVTEKSGRFYLTCTDTAAVSEKGAYVLNLKLTLVDGREQEASLKLKIKRTAIRLKLNPGKLTLNKAVNDTASVAVSCNLKDYELVKPVWQLMDKSGKNPVAGKLDIFWNDGKLRIGTNANTEYGATYKLLVAPEAGATPTALTVSIPAEAKSNVTATMKVKGSLDVIRDGQVLVIPGYKNVSAETARTETLRILRSDNKVVTDQFNIVKNHDGTYAVSIADGAEIDLTKKYQIQLTAVFGSLAVSAKPGNISIKMGSAKVTAQVKGTLFAEDRNSRVTLTFSSSDEALKDVARIEIKDAKNAELFEIFDYGNGRFGIGFKNGQPVRSAKPITVSLNIFLEGNTTAKPNATGKLKISIVP